MSEKVTYKDLRHSGEDIDQAVDDIAGHKTDTAKYITAQERTAWNSKADNADFTTHTSDSVKHITSAERQSWNGKVDKVTGKGLSTNDYTTEEKDKLAGLSNYDDTEVKAAITAETTRAEAAEASIKSDLKAKQDTLTFDTTPTKGSTNPVTSGGVYEALPYFSCPPLANGTDLNDAPLGRCYLPASNTDYDNMPMAKSNTTFVLETTSITGGRSPLIQKLQPITKNVIATIFVRIYTSSAWGEWYKFEGTAVET